MKRTISTPLLEISAYTVMAVLMATFVIYLCYVEPVTFLRLIAEDQWGEYATAVSFGVCGLLLTLLLFCRVPRLEKVVLLIIGLGAFFIAGEEVSWGQRIFGFATPQLLSQFNIQGELNLHNLDGVDNAHLRSIAVHLIVGWLLLSSVVAVGFPRYRDRVQRMGIPLIPVRLFPIFLLAPYFLHSWPVLRSDEFIELFLGMAMAAWALDRFLQYKWVRYSNGLQALGIIGGMFGLIVVTSVILTHITPHNYWLWRWLLNYNAAYAYPKYQMFDQSQKVYDYIYANPKYITKDTRIRHGRILLEVGKRKEAIETLMLAAENLEAKDPPEAKQAEHWIRLGSTQMLLGRVDQANIEFDKSNEIYQKQFVSHPDVQQDALILWWMARTHLARGDVSTAVKMAKNARKHAASRKLRRELDQWIECTHSQNLYGPWYCYSWVEFVTRSF